MGLVFGGVIVLMMFVKSFITNSDRVILFPVVSIQLGSESECVHRGIRVLKVVSIGRKILGVIFLNDIIIYSESNAFRRRDGIVRYRDNFPRPCRPQAANCSNSSVGCATIISKRISISTLRI